MTPLQALIEYYYRIAVEQFFDTFKNEIFSSPVRLHSEDAIQGHMLICFIASFFYVLIRKRMQLFDQNYINISPTYNGDSFLECDSIDNFETDVMEQEVSKKLARTSVSDFFFELQGQKANIYEEELVLDNK